MPDRHGFNLLGEAVRCIDCEAGGPLWRWPERKRRRHASRHRPLARRRAGDRRRQRVLLAAPPTGTHEEKEAITMARQKTTKGEPAHQVAIDVLRQAGEPLHAKEIAKRVLESGRSSGLKGKTPEATISAMLAVGSKPGGPFKRIDKGTYILADATPPAEDAPTDKPEAKPRSRKRQKETPAA
ncbi:MAG TPA: winged helix-turn-helix domain-containing protein [Gaiellaceae bacterium]|nr:winged helix-turn-helix domain-containing protein [Gaiellaceae bacterium]